MNPLMLIESRWVSSFLLRCPQFRNPFGKRERNSLPTLSNIKSCSLHFLFCEIRNDNLLNVSPEGFLLVKSVYLRPKVYFLTRERGFNATLNLTFIVKSIVQSSEGNSPLVRKPNVLVSECTRMHFQNNV